MAGNEQNKSLKFSFAIEDTSFQKTMTAIGQLTSKLQELARVAGSINLPSGGISAGGGGSGLLSGIGVSTQKSIGLPQSGGGGVQRPTNVGGVLTQGLVADSKLFSTIAQGSKAALTAPTMPDKGS